MQIFNPEVLSERLGPRLIKDNSLKNLEKAEKYLTEQVVDKYKWELAYDVMANEPPFFKTMGYTEYTGSILFQPLTQPLRDDQIIEAYYDSDSTIIDYASYLRNKFKDKNANKYLDRQNCFSKFPPKKCIVALPGSNKLKDHSCISKMHHINDKHKNNFYFKPHPLTTLKDVGELQDFFGEDRVLPRDADLYMYIAEADKVYTTHMSESAAYSFVLGKEIEPIDVHHRVHESSFYSINRLLFRKQDEGDSVINRIFSSYKSGLINLDLELDWKKKIDKYLKYADTYRNKSLDWYIIKDHEESNENTSPLID